MNNKGPKEVLDKYKWHPKLCLDNVEIVIEHRGAPNDTRIIEGSEILDLGKGFMTVRGVYKTEVEIPYHRILKIINNEIIWESVSK